MRCPYKHVYVFYDDCPFSNSIYIYGKSVDIHTKKMLILVQKICSRRCNFCIISVPHYSVLKIFSSFNDLMPSFQLNYVSPKNGLMQKTKNQLFVNKTFYSHKFIPSFISHEFIFSVFMTFYNFQLNCLFPYASPGETNFRRNFFR